MHTTAERSAAPPPADEREVVTITRHGDEHDMAPGANQPIGTSNGGKSLAAGLTPAGPIRRPPGRSAPYFTRRRSQKAKRRIPPSAGMRGGVLAGGRGGHETEVRALWGARLRLQPGSLGHGINSRHLPADVRRWCVVVLSCCHPETGRTTRCRSVSETIAAARRGGRHRRTPLPRHWQVARTLPGVSGGARPGRVRFGYPR